MNQEQIKVIIDELSQQQTHEVISKLARSAISWETSFNKAQDELEKATGKEMIKVVVETPEEIIYRCIDEVVGFSRINDTLVGMTKTDAMNYCDENLIKYRMLREDQQGFAVTDDFNPERIGFVVDNGIVTEIDFG